MIVLTFNSEEWTSYILTLGMSAVLTVSSLCPTESVTTIFERAKSVGLTKWGMTETQTSRSSFLKEAVSRVYEDQEQSLPTGSPDSPCELPTHDIQTREENRERQYALSQELRSRRRSEDVENHGLGDSFATERPMSEFNTILQNLEGIVNNAPPVPPVPPLTFDRSSNSSGSPAPGTPNHVSGTSNDALDTPKLIPTSEPSMSFPRCPPLHASLVPAPLLPQVQDPVDRAISRMVNELGFNEDDVKWALKITDTGEGIDVGAAEQLLQQQKKKAERNPFVLRGSSSNGKNPLLASVMKHQGTQDTGWRWA